MKILWDQTLLGLIMWGIAIYKHEKGKDNSAKVFYLLGLLLLTFGIFEAIGAGSIVKMIFMNILDVDFSYL